MNAKRLDVLVYCVVFTTIGASGGWIAARQGAPATAHGTEHEAEAHEAGPALSEVTLRNLGVKTGIARPTTFVDYRSIPATIERTPFNEQPVFAPIGGRVLEVAAIPGTVAAAGDVLVTLVRDPIARPVLELTENVVKPAREEIHQAVARLRSARAELDIVETELGRVKRFTGNAKDDDLPILPRQTIIDLRYNQIRAQTTMDQARLELTKHGFTDEQIESIGAGGPIPDLAPENWLRALIANGLWTSRAQGLFGALPEGLREQRWTIATVAELAASGLVSPGFIAWVKELGGDCGHFLEIAALLQRGYAVEDLRLLHDLNALDPVVRVAAPDGGRGTAWNVETIEVTPGSRVAAGTRLLTLLDPTTMYLRTDPVGAEKSDVLRAVAEGAACEATPLVRGSGPQLAGITVDFVRSEAGGHGTVAFATVENSPLATKERADGRVFRSWALRSGLEYVLRVPTRRVENVFVLPSAAVAEDGPHKVVFVPHGDSFERVEVEIAYQDDEVAVIAVGGTSKLSPGDTVVTAGAYSLGLALDAGHSEVDPHAGHHH